MPAGNESRGDMSQVEVYQYLQMIRLDLGDPGYDSYFGNSLPLVPVPAAAAALNCKVDFVKAEKRVMILSGQ